MWSLTASQVQIVQKRYFFSSSDFRHFSQQKIWHPADIWTIIGKQLNKAHVVLHIKIPGEKSGQKWVKTELSVHLLEINFYGQKRQKPVISLLFL